MDIVYHPYYLTQSERWQLYRDTVGDSLDYINKYLYPVGDKDNSLTFRRATAYNPACIKWGVNRIRNAIFDRMHQITRTGGSESYQFAINRNIDRMNNTMNYFVSTDILPELMVMGRVGIMVDNTKRLYVSQDTPYVYTYKTEDILNWNYDSTKLKTVLLRQCKPRVNEYGLTTGTIIEYLYLNQIESGVLAVQLDCAGTLISQELLDLPEIPFIIATLPSSIIDHVVRHQIAMLNLGSMDIMFAMKANVPFYTEQTDFGINFGDKKTDETVVLGVSKGRQYPKGLERPDFIHPSSEPLTASMEKQRALDEEVQRLLDLAVSNLTASRVSEGTKKTEFRGLEGGLSAIGKILESVENNIARYWAMYDQSGLVASVKYPETYQMDSEEQRLINSEKLADVCSRIDSNLTKREGAKLIVHKIFGQSTDPSRLDRIYKEIDAADNVLAANKKLYWSENESPNSETDVGE